MSALQSQASATCSVGEPASTPATARKRVCVIGAGISGLATAKVLTSDGFEVVVFERAAEIGGVWASSHTYPGLRANNSRLSYGYSDFPYAPDAEEYPTAGDVRRFLWAYAAHFGLASCLRLGVSVSAVSALDDAFSVETRSADGHQETHAFDFVAVCTGVFSEPFVPAIQNRERFDGPIVHSSQFTEELHRPGSHVVVLGGGKSAFDCATRAAQQGCTTTLVCRSPHWMAPRRLLGFVPSERFFLTRAFELMLRYHHLTRLERLVHGSLRPAVRLFWLVQSWLLRTSLRLPDSLVPRTPLPYGFEYLGVGADFYEAVRLGQLQVVIDEIESVFDGHTLALAAGTTLRADVVVCATGWRLSLPFLDQTLRDAVMPDGRLHLYRHILPPRRRTLGLIGFASSTANALTSEIAAHWLSDVFSGRLDLGPADRLDAEIAAVLAWSADTFPGRAEGQFVGPYVSHYLDDLLGDMDLPTRRSRSLVHEYFGPVWPSRYASVSEQRRQPRRRPTRR